MVYYAVVGCYNHSKMKDTTEKISYFRLPSEESLRRTWLSRIRRQDLQQITIAFVLAVSILKKISFNTIYRHVVFYLPIKSLFSFVSFHVFNVWKRVLKVITVCLEIPSRNNSYHMGESIQEWTK